MTSSPAWTQEGLDGVDPHPVPPRRKGQPTEKAGVKWARYKVLKPVHCDECVMIVHKNWTKTHTSAPLPAVYRRTEGGVTKYLCWNHTEQQRRNDGLAPIKPRRG